MARPRIHDETVRRRLLEETSRMIADQGAPAVSLRTVAAAAETSTAAIYSLFGGREELVSAVVAEGFERFGEHLSAVPTSGSPWQDLRGLGVAYRAFALDSPRFYQVMFGATAPDEGRGRPVDAPTFAMLREAVARCLVTSDADEVETQALSIWGLVHGLVSLELNGLIPGTRTARDRIYARALEGVPGMVGG
ncbi:TetR/AcrR family transcriptional regulator [Nesterenkonia halophila]|uniref:TetR/AcrR family transcriptional regulator n=1 Tax=Nesterenkonia halophila TaxID=302044 RepID=UPI001291C6CC|nr:TetR/AcrR family transcriptional regulator [Nesterenkonia halophila]